MQQLLFPCNLEMLRLTVFINNYKSEDQTMEVESETDHDENEYFNFIGVYQNDIPYDFMKKECKEITLKERNYNDEEINTNLIEKTITKKNSNS